MEKKIKSKGSNYESKKGRAIIFKTTYFLGLKHIAMKVHSEIPYGYRVMMGTRIVCKKTNQRAVNLKLRKGEQPFLYRTCRSALIHIASQSIPYGYLWRALKL